MDDREPLLSLMDLAKIVCEGDVEGELQERLTKVLRTDPRFTEQFEELDTMAAEAGAEDLWEGLDLHRDFDRLLAVPVWEDPAEVLNPERDRFYQISYRKLLAVAEARLARAEDPAPIRDLRDRLLRAEKGPAQQAVYAVAEALSPLSQTTADKVVAEVRSKYWEKDQ
ncbi:MAG: hypothetical protein V3T72_17140 [Thermoanaerobaculia bacterium]